MFDITMHIIADRPIVPLEHMDSFKKLYDTVVAFRKEGIQLEKKASFADWTDHPDHMNLCDKEYVFCVWSVVPQFADIKHIMLHYDAQQIASALRKALEVLDYETYVGIATMLAEINVSAYFTTTNPDTLAKIEQIKAKREKFGHMLLINPYGGNVWYENYACAGPRDTENTWDHPISPYPKVAQGNKLLVDSDTFHDRFEAFSCGVFNASQSGDASLAFPHDNIVFAGGAITKMLHANHSPKTWVGSDLDMFVVAERDDVRRATVEAVVRWFMGPKTLFFVNSSVISIYIIGMRRKFQLISSNVSSIWGVLNNFDLTHIKWAFGFLTGVLTTHETVMNDCKGISVCTESGHYRDMRMIKAMHMGYAIKKTPNLAQVGAANVLDNPASPEFQKHVRTLNKFYFPIPDPEIDPETDRARMVEMCSADSLEAPLVEGFAKIMGGFVLGGNFLDYSPVYCSTFNKNLVTNLGRFRRRAHRFILFNGMHRLRVHTGAMTCEAINEHEYETVLTLTPTDPEFEKFAHTLEAFYIEQTEKDPHRIIDSQGRIVIKMRNDVIAANFLKGRDANGNPINLREDVRQGDKLQLVVTITFLMMENRIDLEPAMITKLNRVDDSELRNSVAQIVDLANSTKVVAPTLDYE